MESAIKVMIMIKMMMMIMSINIGMMLPYPVVVPVPRVSDNNIGRASKFEDAAWSDRAKFS